MLFDIILRTETKQPLKVAAENLHLSIHSLASTQHYFPNPRQIDQENIQGYTKAAPEFSDSLRITTKNFHELSYGYFVDAIAKYIKPEMKCLEIGPGQGWLKKNLPLSEIDYTGIDISPEMIRHNNTGDNIQSSARFINFPDKYFDLIIASLADPYCYPTALCEIRRVLKPLHPFIFSSPSRHWSDGIREKENKFKTKFRMKDNSFAETFSFSFTIEELKKLLFLCGLSICEYKTANGGRLIHQEISPAITKSENNIGVSISELSILNFVVAIRKGE